MPYKQTDRTIYFPKVVKSSRAVVLNLRLQGQYWAASCFEPGHRKPKLQMLVVRNMLLPPFTHLSPSYDHLVSGKWLGAHHSHSGRIPTPHPRSVTDMTAAVQRDHCSRRSLWNLNSVSFWHVSCLTTQTRTKHTTNNDDFQDLQRGLFFSAYNRVLNLISPIWCQGLLSFCYTPNRVRKQHVI